MNNKDFEPIRIRIMQEAYELADRGDAEGYNSVKVMCNDVQNLLRREWVGLTDENLENIKLLTFEKEINSDGEEQEAVDLDHLMRATEQLCKERNT